MSLNKYPFVAFFFVINMQLNVLTLNEITITTGDGNDLSPINKYDDIVTMHYLPSHRL